MGGQKSQEKTLIELLRKMWTSDKVNWVEALPRALRVYHDNPGESGLIPFQVLFGRGRNVAGVPYDPPRECEGAQAFFNRMEELDQRVANILNSRHHSAEVRSNQKRASPSLFTQVNGRGC